MALTLLGLALVFKESIGMFMLGMEMTPAW